MLKDTIKRRTKVCEGCSRDFVASQKKSLSKARYCTRKCFLKTITKEQRIIMAKKASTHGMYKTRIYRIWGAMKQRCLNKNAFAYHRYGGSGVTIEENWQVFENFYRDMGISYQEGLTLDRIDGSKGYSKENCRWATRKEQSSNIKNNVWIDCEGEVLHASDCARKLRVNPTTIFARVYSGKLKRLCKKTM